MSVSKRLAVFQYWFKWSGHWLYDTREAAVKVWASRGIVGLPDAPAGVEKLLAEWIAADPIVPLIAKWRAEAAGAAA